MPTVTVDLAGLLEQLRVRDHYSLPLEIKPGRPRMDLVELQRAVNAAIARADELARDRVPSDPTTCTPADVALKSVVAEINDGLMTEAEIEAWLGDFSGALEGCPAKVGPAPESTRVPWQKLEQWATVEAPTPTAFLHFTAEEYVAPNGTLHKRLDSTVIDRVADDLAAWVRLPAGVAEVSRGLAAFVCPPGRVASELRSVFDEQLGVTEFTLAPRRHALARFSFKATAVLQRFDETLDAAGSLAHLLEGLRRLGPLLDYAYVRMDRPVLPDESVSVFNLGREPTVAEQLIAHRNAAAAHTIGPCVAQVLNPAHLRRGPDLSLFTREDLGGGRELVVARDQRPWLESMNPDPTVLEEAGRGFGPITLTQAAYDAIPHLASGPPGR